MHMWMQGAAVLSAGYESCGGRCHEDREDNLPCGISFYDGLRHFQKGRIVRGGSKSEGGQYGTRVQDSGQAVYRLNRRGRDWHELVHLYLCKAAMDIVAKHVRLDRHGVRIAELDEMSYRQYKWNHWLLTDFWRGGFFGGIDWFDG